MDATKPLSLSTVSDTKTKPVATMAPDAPDAPYLANRIQEILDERGFTVQPSSYVRGGFNAKTWGMARRNELVLTNRQVRWLCELLNVEPDELFTVAGRPAELRYPYDQPGIPTA